MKNEDIHKSFNHADIRDFLGRAFHSSQGGGVGELRTIDKKIQELNDRRKAVIMGMAVKDLAAMLDWEEWDISALVPYDNKTYFPFVGTETEFDTIVSTIKAERE